MERRPVAAQRIASCCVPSAIEIGPGRHPSRRAVSEPAPTSASMSTPMKGCPCAAYSLVRLSVSVEGRTGVRAFVALRTVPYWGACGFDATRAQAHSGKAQDVRRCLRGPVGESPELERGLISVL